MDAVISFTPEQLWAALMALAGGLVSLAAAAAIIGKIITKFKAPNAEQDKKIKDHEARLKEHDEKFKAYDTYLKNDKTRLDTIEEGNKVTQRALLALLSHALDGNSIEPLKKAEEGLRQYLIERK